MTLALRAPQEPRALRRVADGSRTEYLAFLLAGESYAVEIRFIQEILKTFPITEVPRARREVLGVMSVRGRLITVIDLRRRLQLPETSFDGKTRILLLNSGPDDSIGLVVDEVLQVHYLGADEIEPAQALGGDQPPHIAGIGRPEGTILVLLDLAPILELP